MSKKVQEDLNKLRNEINEWKRKASKYDELAGIVDKFYEMDESGELIDKDSDLCSIGEATASFFGYI